MILVGGTNLKPEDLPLADIITYSVENVQTNLQVKLRAGAKSNRFTGIFLGPAMQGVEVPAELSALVKYFTSDEDLKDQLGAAPGRAAAQVLENQPVEEEITEPKAVEGISATPDLKPEKDVADAVTRGSTDEVSFAAMNMVKLTEEVDRGMGKLELRDRLIAQKNAQISELRITLQTTLDNHEAMMLNVRDRYKDQIDLANNSIAALEKNIKELTLSEEELRYMNNFVHASNPRAIQRAGITNPQMDIIKSRNKKGSHLRIFAAGPGDSFYAMSREVKKYLSDEVKAPVHVYDFTGDPFFVGRVGLKYDQTSLDVAMGLAPSAAAQVRQSNTGHNVTWHSTGMFNDVAFLSIDWVDFLARAFEAAEGAEVLLLFNSVTSFSVRETVSRLSIVGPLLIFVTCNGDCLYSLPAIVSFIPTNRFSVVLLDFIEDLRSSVKEMEPLFTILAFSVGVKWDKLDFRRR